MKARSIGVVIAAVFLAGLVFAAGNMADAESKMTIRFSTWHPPASREVKTVWEPMLQQLKEKSNGRIDYTMYAGAALGAGPAHYDIVKNGLSDMGYFTATWTPGRFPLSDVLSLATWVDGKDIAVDIGNEMAAGPLKSEYSDVEVMELNGCVQAYIWTKDPVKSLADLKGKKIRSPGGQQTNYIKALGAEPVFMPLGDVYLALETGTIDGLVTCPPLVLAYKLFEVAKYGVATTFGCVSEGMVMNKKSWENTPDDLKPLIKEVCGNPFRTTGGLNQAVYKQMIDEITGKGVELFTLPDAEAQQWYALFQAETKKWVDDLEAKGLPAKETTLQYNKIAESKGVGVVAFPADWK